MNVHGRARFASALITLLITVGARPVRAQNQDLADTASTRIAIVEPSDDLSSGASRLFPFDPPVPTGPTDDLAAGNPTGPGNLSQAFPRPAASGDTGSISEIETLPPPGGVPATSRVSPAHPNAICPASAIRGTIGSGSSDRAFVTGLQTSRLFRNSVSSLCSPPKPYPGTSDVGTTFSFDSFSFTNGGASPACITVILNAKGANQILGTAYLDSFNPANVQTNYLGDSGNSDFTRRFSFVVPAGHNFVVVLSRVNNAGSPTSLDYTFSVLGIPGCTNCPPANVTGTIGSPSSIPSSDTGTQVSRLFRDAVESTCGTPKATPGTTDPGINFAYDAYTFLNSAPNPVCITVISTAGGASQLLAAAYLDRFDPANVQTNYLGDAGNSDLTRGFSFEVPANRFFVVVQSRVNNAANPTSLAYGFRVLGLAGCPSCPPGAIAGTIGSGSGSWPASSKTHGGRVALVPVFPDCLTPKSFPGIADTGTSFAYDAFTFLNPSTAETCVIVTAGAGAAGQLLVVVYLDRFNPFDLQENYLADSGTTGVSRTFSFVVPAGRSFVVVENRVNTDASPPSLAYSLSVSGMSCVPAPGARFFPLTPCRVVDTRNANGPLGGPVILPNDTRTFPLSGSICGIPTNAEAVSFNVTVASPTAPGSLKLGAGNVPPGAATALSFKAAAVRANNAISRISQNGTAGVLVKNESAGTAHVILDVNGYFK